MGHLFQGDGRQDDGILLVRNNLHTIGVAPLEPLLGDLGYLAAAFVDLVLVLQVDGQRAILD